MPNIAHALTLDELRRRAPAVFAEAPASSTSSRYRQVPTTEVLAMLADRDYLPVSARQSSSRSDDGHMVARHMLRFRHRAHLDGAPMNVGDEVAEMVMTNSHDGSSAYQFSAGLFRLVCSNGLVCPVGDTGSIAVRHTGGPDFSKGVIDATYQIIEQTPTLLGQAAEWKRLPLSPRHQLAYAEAAHVLMDSPPQFRPKALLDGRRPEDRPAPDGTRSLWHTMNTVQESIMQGGVRGRAGGNDWGRRIRTRPIADIARDVKINRNLWTLAERLAAAVS